MVCKVAFAVLNRGITLAIFISPGKELVLNDILHRVPTGFFKSNSSIFKTLLRPFI